ncbi:transport permease protein [Spirochaetia bacterium]|nr:transport permease protein [Spirochaetia bacterium]
MNGAGNKVSMQFSAVLWKEWVQFKSKWISISLSALVGPLLYLTAFGWGLGGAVSVNGAGYIAFIIPGIIAMNAMTNGFGVIANDINLSRNYMKTFEAVMIAPVGMAVYTIARVTANTLRSLYGAALIIGASFLFQTSAALAIDGYFVLVLILNGYVFSLIGFIAGILITSHPDMAKVSSFVITPMSFLCGTFFPLEKFPVPLRIIFEALPLTQAVKGLRMGFTAPGSLIAPLILSAYVIVLLPLAIRLCGRAE